MLLIPSAPCQVSPGTEFSDRVCADITACVAGQYQAIPPSATGDRSCATLTKCTIGEQSAAPTSTSDRVCAVTTDVNFADARFGAVLSPPGEKEQALYDAMAVALVNLGFATVTRVADARRVEDDGTIAIVVVIEGEEEALRLRKLMDSGQLTVKFEGLVLVAKPFTAGVAASTAGKRGTSIGLIVGVVCGAVVIVAVCAVFIFKLQRRSIEKVRGATTVCPSI